mgnify:CR=1 FL=1|jgi:hypothetical protein
MFKRLQELLRQMGQAAHAIGNTELEEKFAKSLEMLERPNTVVFNPSYVISLTHVWISDNQVVFVVRSASRASICIGLDRPLHDPQGVLIKVDGNVLALTLYALLPLPSLAFADCLYSPYCRAPPPRSVWEYKHRRRVKGTMRCEPL